MKVQQKKEAEVPAFGTHSLLNNIQKATTILTAGSELISIIITRKMFNY
jgi:hypothetical protein